MRSSLSDAENAPKLALALIFLAISLIGPAPLPAQERSPSVARLSFVSGPVTYSRGDDPNEWDDAIENVPVTIGDRIYAPEGGRAELQISSGNFVRLAPRSYLSTLNLSDDTKQFYLGEGAASFNIKRLQSDEVIEIDTPNVSVTLEDPGQYRVAVDDDGNSRVTVRRGRVIVATGGRQIAVENSEVRVYGIDSPRYEIVRLPATDAFDRWATERDERFDRAYTDAYRHASDDIIGAEDLAEYGRWEEIPEYGYAWTPSRVVAGWAPFSDGRWYWQDPWGWSWISNERWGWATSHYGRWTLHRSRWYWVPVRPRTRVRYAPAVVEFVRVRDHVGWFPLHPRDRHIPWWERRDRQRFDRNVTYVNRTYVTVVNHNTFISAKPVRRNIVRDSVIVREVSSSRFISDSLPIPSRSSLRIVSENGGRRGHRPSDKIVNRVAVVRTAVPAEPRAFQDKLPEIQKNQGKAVAPARTLAATRDDRRVRVRPAAEAGRGGFAPRNPGATSGPAPQPLTEARGKKLATRTESGPNNAERTDRAQKSPAQPAQPEPSKGTASRPESPRVEQDRDRQRQEKQTTERERQAQQQQEIERKKQAQQEERKAQSQKQQQERERQQQERQAQEQKQRELERRQAQQKEEERRAQPQKQQPAQERRQEPQERQPAQQRLEELERRQAQQREEERKTQLQQNRQEQERREQLKQQQVQERQAQQQRQQEQERRQRQAQQERASKAQAQQQQEQARREQQLRQQQAQERQARDQQRQEVERRQQQREQQERNVQAQRREQARAQQLIQQQAQEQRKAQQAQRQQEQERRPQPRPQPQKEAPVPQAPPRQPGPF
jgi:hypothetical protein